MSVSKKEAQPKRRRPPATTPEARENQLIALAVDLAEKQLLEGTASSQVLSHFLKLATVREKKEMERLQHEVELLKAKTDVVKSTKNSEILYKKAVQAMSSYSGRGDVDDDY